METILDQTETAYSFDRYTLEGWKACANHLLSLGLSESETIAFLNSKHMRWAGDCSGGEYGQLGLADLKSYLNAYPQYATVAYVKNNLV